MPTNFKPSHHQYHLPTMGYPYHLHLPIRAKCIHHQPCQPRQWKSKLKSLGVMLVCIWWIWQWHQHSCWKEVSILLWTPTKRDTGRLLPTSTVTEAGTIPTTLSTNEDRRYSSVPTQTNLVWLQYILLLLWRRVSQHPTSMPVPAGKAACPTMILRIKNT